MNAQAYIATNLLTFALFVFAGLVSSRHKKLDTVEVTILAILILQIIWGVVTLVQTF